MSTYADPRVFEGLFGSDSLGWVNGQHLVDQVLCLWSHCVPLWGRELRNMEKEVGVTVGMEGSEANWKQYMFPEGLVTSLLPHVSA